MSVTLSVCPAQQLAHMRPVLLLDMRVVILLVGVVPA